jgi:diguanylate cyclase (GGDEF)-like protein
MDDNIKQNLRTWRDVQGYLERQTGRSLVFHGGALVAVIGLADLLTEPELSFYVFYFIPILLVTSYGGMTAGVVISLTAAVVWSAADHYSGAVYGGIFARYWNIIVRFLSFLLVAAMQHLLGRERHLARTDFLTKLANRQYFYEIAEKEISRSRRYQMPFTVAYIDLDNFKQVNDRYGHSTGNRLLQTVAALLKQNIRDVDTAARLGGDEFALLLPQADQEAGKSVLLKLQALLNEAMREHAWPVTFSIGVVTFHQTPDSIRAMVNEVDQRMYTVKEKGKNGALFDVIR